MDARKIAALLGSCLLVTGCGDDDDGNDGSNSCIELMTCTAECGEDQACQQACAEGVDSELMAKFIALAFCDAMSGCGGDTACVQENCSDELDACG